LVAHLVRTKRSGEELIFGRTTEAAFVSSTINYHAQDRWEHKGLRPITMHECRHTFASLLIDAGANPKALQAFMGHSNIGITFDTYGHLLPGSREEVRRLMDKYLADEDKFGGGRGRQILAELAGRQNQQLGGLSFEDFDTGPNPFTERETETAPLGRWVASGVTTGRRDTYISIYVDLWEVGGLLYCRRSAHCGKQ
jgi:hypothetical protein